MKTDTQNLCSQSGETDEFEKIIDNYWSEAHSLCPSILFHYSTQESICSIITSQQMWASAFEMMNDNTEFRAGMSLAKMSVLDTFSSLGIDEHSKDDMIQRWQKFLDCELKNPSLRPYILRFSSKKDSEHLWTKYSNNYRGAILEFKHSQGTDLNNGYFVKVSYDEKESLKDFKKFNDQLIQYFNKNTCQSCLVSNLKNLNMALLRSMFRLAISYKNKSWSDEQEWRMVVFVSNTTGEHLVHGKVNFLFRNSEIIDFLKIKLDLAALTVESFILT